MKIALLPFVVALATPADAGSAAVLPQGKPAAGGRNAAYVVARRNVELWTAPRPVMVRSYSARKGEILRALARRKDGWVHAESALGVRGYVRSSEVAAKAVAGRAFAAQAPPSTAEMRAIVAKAKAGLAAKSFDRVTQRYAKLGAPAARYLLYRLREAGPQVAEYDSNLSQLLLGFGSEAQTAFVDALRDGSRFEREAVLEAVRTASFALAPGFKDDESEAAKVLRRRYAFLRGASLVAAVGACLADEILREKALGCLANLRAKGFESTAMRIGFAEDGVSDDSPVALIYLLAVGEPGMAPKLMELYARVVEGSDEDLFLEEALGLESPCVEALFDLLLRDKEWATRMYAVEALGNRGRRSDLPRVEAALGEEVGEVRRMALVAAAQLGGERHFDAMVAAARSEEGFERRAGLSALGHLRKEEGLAVLEEASRSAEKDARLAAAEALSVYGGPKALARLRAMESDADLEVRSHAKTLADRLAARPGAPPKPRGARKDKRPYPEPC